jgi:hypothetical protein
VKGRRKTMEKTSSYRLETTLSDLIAAAGEVAFEYSENDKDAFTLAQFALVELLRKTTQRVGLDKEFENIASPSQLIH